MKKLISVSLIAAALALSGCTATPLYGSGQIGQDVAGETARIHISPARDRVTQEMRNHLIFAFYRGGAAPADPKYQMDFFVRASTRSSTTTFDAETAAREGVPTSTISTMTAVYTVINTKTGEQVSQGSASAMASTDQSEQQFANLRAVRNAEDRTARELAAQVSLSVAGDVRRYLDR